MRGHEMRAAVCEAQGARVEVVEGVEADPPREGEVVVRVAHCGLCHSDLTVQQSVSFPGPVILGHEAAGWVEEVGRGVVHLKEGDAVVCTVTPSCGLCYFCARGETPLCVNMWAAFAGTLPAGGTGFRRGDEALYRSVGVGAFTERVVMPASAVVPVPPDTSLAAACLLGCGVGTGLGSALNTARVQPGDSVVVFGLGGVGIAAVQGARIAGASRIVGVDPVPDRREAAFAFGATDVLDPSDDVAARVLALTAVGADHAIETAGRADAFSASLASIRSGGTVTLVGVPAEQDAAYPLDNTVLMILAEKRVQGCVYGSSHPQRDIPRYLDMARRGTLDIEGMITARRPLEEVPAAIDDLAAGHGLRTVIDL